MNGMELLDSPVITPLEEDLLGSAGGFPNSLLLIQIGTDKYAANNATLADGQSVNGLACFPTPDDAATYAGLLAGLDGEFVKKSFDEARDIAKSKPTLDAMFLFVDGKIVEVHFVR
ncbi:MAG: hypothetical protein C4320_08755 [Armatimonadota bacterium]